MKTTVLITRLSESEQKTYPSLKPRLKAFLTKCGLDVSIESQAEMLKWHNYDIVVCMPPKFDKNCSYHQHLVSELAESVAQGKQKRMAWYDDSYFSPLSLLKQAGLDEKNEFTHCLSLVPDKINDRKQYVLFKDYFSESVNKAVKIVAPIWSVPIDIDTQTKPGCQKSTVFYGGQKKFDRQAALSSVSDLVEYEKLPYLDYLDKTSKALAGIVLNSEEHKGNITLRFFETNFLTIAIWPSNITVDYYSPKRQFSNRSEFKQIVDELRAQTELQRALEIAEQKSNVLKAADLHWSRWANSGGLSSLIEKLCA